MTYFLTWEGGASNENKMWDGISISQFGYSCISVQLHSSGIPYASSPFPKYFVVSSYRLFQTMTEYFFGLGCCCGYDIRE